MRMNLWPAMGRGWLVALGISTLAMAAAAPASAADEKPPPVIRIGAPALGTQSGKQVLFGTMGIARAKGWFEEEFKADNVQVEFPGFKGGAPVVGQALANGQIDIAWQGDLLSVIGRSAGMDTRLVLPLMKLTNAYLIVPAGSAIASVKDLRGKRVAYYKGNQVQLQAIRILEQAGLTEKDIKPVMLDPGNNAAALASGEVDAVFTSTDALVLRDKGLGKIIHSTHGDAALTSYNGLVARSDFLQKYPDTTTRVIKVLVRAARFASDPANRDEVLRIWSEGPLPAKYYVEDYGDRPWQDRLSPLLDPLLAQHYRQTEQQLATLGLLRGKRVDVAAWIDDRYLQAALRELKLDHYWQPVAALPAR